MAEATAPWFSRGELDGAILFRGLYLSAGHLFEELILGAVRPGKLASGQISLNSSGQKWG